MKADYQRFDMKVIAGERVYLSARDCAKALGYETKKAFLLDNPGIVKRINGVSELVSEDDYNHLLVKKPKAFDTQHSIEMTKVTTLNAEISSFLGLYGLKLALARPMYEAKAREKSCETIEEFIERYEYPEEAKRILREFQSTKTNYEEYDKEVAFVKDTRIFVPKIMDVNGVTIQCLTMMQKDKLSLYVFLAGDGFFYQPYIYGSYDEYYLDSENNVVDSREEADHIEVWYGNELFAQMHVNTDGELCIPICDEETGEIVQKNIGRTAKQRDFRKYNVFENIIWALQNSEIDRDSVDMSAYTSPGIYMYLEDAFVIELAFQNDPKTVIIDGIVEYDIENKITKICGLPVFPHEALGNA